MHRCKFSTKEEKLRFTMSGCDLDSAGLQMGFMRTTVRIQIEGSNMSPPPHFCV